MAGVHGGLRPRGLDAWTGDLVLDRSFFRLPSARSRGFDREPLEPYNVGPDALLINFKAVRFAFAPTAHATRWPCARPRCPTSRLVRCRN